MSENEKNLTPGERKLLTKLNVKANLIVEFQQVCQDQKIQFNKDVIYGLGEDDLRELIYNFSAEGQAMLKKKIRYETKGDN